MRTRIVEIRSSLAISGRTSAKTASRRRCIRLYRRYRRLRAVAKSERVPVELLLSRAPFAPPAVPPSAAARDQSRRRSRDPPRAGQTTAALSLSFSAAAERGLERDQHAGLSRRCAFQVDFRMTWKTVPSRSKCRSSYHSPLRELRRRARLHSKPNAKSRFYNLAV